MAWRGLHLSRAARLSLADNQCVVGQDSGETRVPLEDIAWIILDTPRATLTTSLLSACMEAGIALIVTDQRHHPNGLILPFHQHHRQADIAAIQIAASTALRNRLWQHVVRGKITNQARVLENLKKAASPLHAMAERVEPGDPANIEARAARYYWSRLFPDFVRDDAQDRRNGMLNYGYSVMRGAVARGLVAAGLLPAIGIHHASALNAFNLADDMLEPFRPIVDNLAWRLSNEGSCRDGNLTIDDRRELAGILLNSIRFGQDSVTALVATEKTAAALVRAFESASAKALILPEIDPIDP